MRLQIPFVFILPSVAGGSLSEGPGVGRGFECTVPRVVCVTASQECAMS